MRHDSFCFLCILHETKALCGPANIHIVTQNHPQLIVATLQTQRAFLT